MALSKYMKTAQTALSGRTNGGIVYLLPQMALKIIYLIPLLFLWRVVTAGGADSEMTLPQLLCYTYSNALLGDLLIVKTYLTDWDYDSKSTALFTRHMSVYGQVISRTVGEWAPTLLLFSLPMALVAPLFGISLLPQSAWFLPSLLLCVSLGFAMEFLFFCVTLRLRNVSWLTMVIRSALASFFSGTVIPFRILPFGLDRWMTYQPFGSLGGAPLSLLVGTAEAAEIIPVQLFWNVLLWSAAVFWFNKSRERMVSFGG
jgi:ABC-2 type transport system permease protein